MALIEPGDEVVLFEPMYDAYLPLVRRAGGVPRFVTLQPPHFRLSEEALAQAFSPKPKWSCSTTPSIRQQRSSPPTTSRFSPGFASASIAIALCDEVWEHVVFDGRRHQPVLGFPACASAA
jgi:aspartate/methionine/tyrosine aminotransferase